MKIAFVLHFYDQLESGEALIQKHYSSWNLWEALKNRGLEVHVFYRFHRAEQFAKNGVQFHFIPDNLPHQARRWHRCKKYNEAVTEICRQENIQIIQAHNPFTARSHYYLKKLNPRIPYFIQDHAGLLQFLFPASLRIFLRNIDALIVSAEGLEAPWVRSKIFKEENVHHIMEASSEWRLNEALLPEYETARVPAFLWIGNLDQNKDPLCVLRALKNYHSDNLTFKLRMIFRKNELLAEVKSFISENALTQNIELIGAVNREQIKMYLHQSDYFIAASKKEGSGYAMMEAMSCGVVPLGTQIPSFIGLTKNETMGRLYPVGNVDDLTEILRGLPFQAVSLEEKRKVVAFFDTHFSYAAIAEQLENCYRAALG